MTDSNEKSPREPETAAEWFVAIDASSPDEVAAARFSAWLDGSADHEIELERCAAAAEIAARLRADPELRWAYDEAAAVASRKPSARPATGGSAGALAALTRGGASVFSPLGLFCLAALLVVVAVAVVLVDFGGSPQPGTTAGVTPPSAARARPDRTRRIMANLPAANPAVTLAGQVIVDSGSVAVLPFTAPPGVDAAGVSYREFASRFYRGVVAELRTIPAVYVVAAPALYANAELTPSEIGAQLGTRGVVVGGVGLADGRVQVEASLVDAATNDVLWQMQYEVQVDELGAMQSDLIDNIAAALVDPEQRARSAAVNARTDSRATTFAPDVSAFE